MVITATLLQFSFFFFFFFCFLRLKGEEKEEDPRTVAGLVASLYTAAAVCKCMGTQRLLPLDGQLPRLSPTFVWASSEMNRLNQV